MPKHEVPPHLCQAEQCERDSNQETGRQQDPLKQVLPTRAEADKRGAYPHSGERQNR